MKQLWVSTAYTERDDRGANTSGPQGAHHAPNLAAASDSDE
jgi:hypothetical protein